MSENDTKAIAAEYVMPDVQYKAVPALPAPGKDLEASDQPVIGEVFPLGVAVAIGLLTLLGLASEPLHLNDNTAVPDELRLVLAGGLGAALAVLLVSEAALARWKVPRSMAAKMEGLQLPRWYWAPPVLAAAAWATALICLTAGPLHLPGLATAAGLVMFALYANSLVHITTVLNTLAPTLGQVLLCTTVGATLGFGTFWFVAVGVWQGAAPLPGIWLGATAVIFFFGQVAVFIVAGRALGAGLPSVGRPTQKFLSRSAAGTYVVFDGFVFGVVFLIGIMIPLYAVSRDQALHASSLSVVASMVFLPGLIAGVVWGVRNWMVAAETAQNVPESSVPRVLLARARHEAKRAKDSDRARPWKKAREVDEDRIERLSRHLHFQRYGVIALTSLGLSYLAVDLIT